VPRRRLVVLIAALALAAPGTALAQSAGDEQYQDPFAGDDQGTPTPTATAAPAPQPATAQVAPSATAAPAQAPVATTAQAGRQLPRTGNDPVTPAVAGFWLLLGGVALRARTRTR
jgi:LPXTG-motif cell wall-anchored protein